MAEADLGVLGACAVHADRPAVRTCERCGNFACRACLATDEDPDGGLCGACLSREGQVPWEAKDKPWWRRYLETTSAALKAPTATFARLGARPLGPSVGFAALSSVVGFSPLLALVPLIMAALAFIPSAGRDTADIPMAVMLAAVPCALLFYPTLSFIYFTSIGGILHVSAMAMGGKASFGQSLRAAYYTTAWEPISALVFCVYCVPFIGVVAVLGVSVAGAIWRGIALKAFTERVHGLPSNAATAVAVIAAGTWLTVWLGVLALLVAFALFERMR